MLLFQKIGGERSCPRVEGAPAVLMLLDLLAGEEEVRLVAGTNGRGRSARGKNLCSQFVSVEEGDLIAEFLRSSFDPMSTDEAAYFGLIASERATEIR